MAKLQIYILLFMTIIINIIIMHGETVQDGFLAEVRHSIYAR
nr:MAG TPA: hypothetical protein [Caudoviricetes sp.]